MVDALKKRNLDPYSDSRPLEPEDFQKFDYIINMNHENVQEVQKAAQYWKDDLQKPLPSNWKDKVTGQHPYDCNLHMHDHSRYLESVCIMFHHRATTILQQAFSCSPSFYTSTFWLMHDRHSSQSSPTMSYKFLSQPQCGCEFKFKLSLGTFTLSVWLGGLTAPATINPTVTCRSS